MGDHVSFAEKLDRVVVRHDELGRMMADPGLDPRNFVTLSKEYSELGPVVEAVTVLRKAQAELADLGHMMEDAAADAEMRELANAEYYALKDKMPEMEKQLQMMLLPKDAADERNVILEIRAGTGGDEAALFASELFQMYQRYAGLHSWRFEVMELSETGLGGFREAIANISGRGVYARLKFESGVHRVQRVPATEGSGRIHTSTVTGRVLPD